MSRVSVGGDLTAFVAQRQHNWSSRDWWEGEISRAVETSDPTICNLRITLAHYELSLALRQTLGANTGPNFHTWAVWGSKKAGTTIRREDVRGVRPLAGLTGIVLGALVPAAALGDKRCLRLLGVLVGGASFSALATLFLNRARSNVLAGNITVLDDIGRASARFIAAFHDQAQPDQERLCQFLGSLRTGPTEHGGQELLREAFLNYYQARYAPDANSRHEYMLLGNLKAILHEHIRLQPYIVAAMPPPLRRQVTRWLLRFYAGAERLDVYQDVIEWRDESCPDDLQAIENAALTKFLIGPAGWDRTPDTLLGSNARDWSDIHQRMNYICDLFRYRYFDPSLFAAPYSDAQARDIMAGRKPQGPL